MKLKIAIVFDARHFEEAILISGLKHKDVAEALDVTERQVYYLRGKTNDGKHRSLPRTHARKILEGKLGQQAADYFANLIKAGEGGEGGKIRKMDPAWVLLEKFLDRHDALVKECKDFEHFGIEAVVVFDFPKNYTASNLGPDKIVELMNDIYSSQFFVNSIREGLYMPILRSSERNPSVHSKFHERSNRKPSKKLGHLDYIQIAYEEYIIVVHHAINFIDDSRIEPMFGLLVIENDGPIGPDRIERLVNDFHAAIHQALKDVGLTAEELKELNLSNN